MRVRLGARRAWILKTSTSTSTCRAVVLGRMARVFLSFVFVRSVRFCPFLSVSDRFCPFCAASFLSLSVSVRFCPFCLEAKRRLSNEIQSFQTQSWKC